MVRKYQLTAVRNFAMIGVSVKADWWRIVTPEVLAYAAGIIDGEGTVGLCYGGKTDKYRHAHLTVPSTSFELVQFMRVHFGGQIGNKRASKVEHKASFVWVLTYAAALDFLRLIRPYMQEQEKIRRTDLLLGEYQQIVVRNGKYTQAQREARRTFERHFFSVTRKHPRQHDETIQP